jgi:hypothetical protein
MDMVFRDAECRLSKDRTPDKAPCQREAVGTTTYSQASSRNDRSPGSPGWRKQDSCDFNLFLSHGAARRTCPPWLGSKDGCEIRPGSPNRCWEVGGGRTTRQPGQVRKEAALTRPGGSLSSLPLCSPCHNLALSGRPAGRLDIGPAPIKSLA